MNNSKKILLREKLIYKRNSLKESYRNIASEIIMKKIINLKEYRLSNTIFCYISTKYEVTTFDLISDALLKNKRVFVPYIVKKGIMELREIKSLYNLQENKYGILEPTIYIKKISVEEIDLSIIPCVSVDKNGNRLGYGGGYYDRLFENYETENCIVICFDELIEESIPTDFYDVKFRNIITDKYVKLNR